MGVQGNQMNIARLSLFFQANWRKILLRGGLSLCVAVVVLALYVSFAPRSERYACEVQVTLESRDGSPCYPNGDPFGAHDIISAPVLNIVWKKYGLDAKGVKFEDFCGWFGIIGYDKERAKIDAEFNGKMTKRNITVTELTAVQKEYENRLATLSANRFVLSMSPGAMLLDRETAARLMNDIPAVWFSEYSRLKAPHIPAVVSGDSVRSYLARVKTDGSRVLELLDFLRFYSSELAKTCDYIRNDLMRGRNACVEGIDLGAYESQLDILKSEMLRMKYRVLSDGATEEMVSDYINARLEDMACEQKQAEERIAAVSQVLDAVVGERRPVEDPKAAGSRMNGSAGSNPVTVQADSGFFADFAAMVRRDANQNFVRKYAEELAGYRKQLADISARKLYYDQITDHMKANRSGKSGQARSADVLKEASAMAGNLLEVGDKIVAFRDVCFAIYRTPDQFFSIASLASYGKSFVLPLPYFLAGLLAVWILANLMWSIGSLRKM